MESFQDWQHIFSFSLSTFFNSSLSPSYSQNNTLSRNPQFLTLSAFFNSALSQPYYLDLSFTTMVMSIWKKSVNSFINRAKDIRLFRPCTWWADSPEQSQSPPELQSIRVDQTNATHSTDEPGGGRPRPAPSTADGNKMSVKQLLLVMGVCLTAVGAALQALQTSKPLPMAFHWFCVALELAFLSMIVPIYIRPRNQLASLVMHHAAILLMATAFMLAISMNFPTPILVINMALYFIFVLLNIVAKLLMP